MSFPIGGLDGFDVSFIFGLPPGWRNKKTHRRFGDGLEIVFVNLVFHLPPPTAHMSATLRHATALFGMAENFSRRVALETKQFIVNFGALYRSDSVGQWICCRPLANVES